MYLRETTLYKPLSPHPPAVPPPPPHLPIYHSFAFRYVFVRLVAQKGGSKRSEGGIGRQKDVSLSIRRFWGKKERSEKGRQKRGETLTSLSPSPLLPPLLSPL